MKVQPHLLLLLLHFLQKIIQQTPAFYASLDDIIIEDCSEGFITYEGLEIGEEHTFQVSAYIPDGGG